MGKSWFPGGPLQDVTLNQPDRIGETGSREQAPSKAVPGEDFWGEFFSQPNGEITVLAI